MEGELATRGGSHIETCVYHERVKHKMCSVGSGLKLQII